jgi:hypothetical protein
MTKTRRKFANKYVLRIMQLFIGLDKSVHKDYGITILLGFIMSCIVAVLPNVTKPLISWILEKADCVNIIKDKIINAGTVI